jgi:regulator of sigma E protease
MLHFSLYYILPFVVVLGILIFCHELGHFLVAKAFGVRVLKFSLGFGPKLIGRTVGHTEYLISSIPLGGYVKMLGEQGDEEEPLPEEEKRHSFNEQHGLKRIAIVAAGPVFNFLLAFVIFCAFHLVAGAQILTPEIGQVREGSPAEQAGLRKGDLIVEIDGREISNWQQVKESVQDRAGVPVRFVVLREDRRLSFQVVPEASVVKNLFGENVPAALVGVVASEKYETLPLGPLAAIREGWRKTWEITELTCLTVVKLLQRVIPINSVGGPVLIGQMAGRIAQESIAYLLPFMAVISVNLALLNLLPVPILDGGMILFLLVEMLIGKPLSLRKREVAQKMGLFLLIALMAVVLYNDLLRLFQPGSVP